MALHSILCRKHLFLLVAAFYAGSAPATAAPFIYVVNGALNANTVSVIDAADNTVIATVPVEFGPMGIAITRMEDMRMTNRDGERLGYPSLRPTRWSARLPSVASSRQVAVAPDGKHAYTTDVCGRLSVIDVATNAVTASIHITSFDTVGVAISPDSSARICHDQHRAALRHRHDNEHGRGWADRVGERRIVRCRGLARWRVRLCNRYGFG